ncbi:MAG: metallophosphoesterase [Deltaproteobacteria bacterium]|nr:MAG: metallophosphoesterase [Deltaproteobacteria bacterium]
MPGYRRFPGELHGRHLRVRRFAGPLDHVTRLSRPIRVAHLSDQHVGRVTPLPVQQAAIAAVNAQKPDLVLLTGDYVCHSLDYLDQLESLLCELKAPAFAVLGNHDHWSGAWEVRRTLHRAGVTLLDNAHTTVRIGSDRLQLVGLDDAYTGHADSRKALRGLRPDLPAIGLSHIAEEAPRLWRAGVPLVLSGHTHSGHIAVARLHHLLIGHAAGHRYVHGLYGDRGAGEEGALYVSAGIGASVFGLRVGERARREVTLFDLGVQPGLYPEHHTEQIALPGRPVSLRKQKKREEQVRRKAWTRRSRRNPTDPTSS